MRLSGHRTRSVFDRYNIVSEDDLIDASTKLQQFLVEAIKNDKVVPIKKIVLLSASGVERAHTPSLIDYSSIERVNLAEKEEIGHD